MGENGSVRFEDNNEAVTLSSLLNKEIVFELENTAVALFLDSK